LQDDRSQRPPGVIRSEAAPGGEPLLIDARGHRCPAPSLFLRKALAAAAPGGVVRLLADDPMARIDVPHLLAQLEARLLSLEEDGGVLIFTVASRS
jgi:tRNA 2-thiouridine synthesizing protein A